MKEEERQQAILLRLARMRTAPYAPGAFFASGFRALDESLGRGFPRGQMVELFGPAGCGKTTLAIQCVAHAQKNAFTAAWIDADHTFDAAYATGLGVDMERVPFAQPATAEQGMEIARQLAGSGAVDLIVVDSAAGFAESSSWVKDKAVRIEENGSAFEATTVGLDARGFLRVRTLKGTQTVLSGTVRER